MTSNQEMDHAGSHHIESKTGKLKLSRELKPENFAMNEHTIAKSDSHKALDFKSQYETHLNGVDAATSMLQPGIMAENVQTSPVKDKQDSLPDDVVKAQAGLLKSVEISEASEKQLPERKRAYHPIVHNILENRTQNVNRRPPKRTRLSFEDNLTVARTNNHGPVSIDQCFPSHYTTIDLAASIPGIFDDAEGDQTFDSKSYNKSTNVASTIRPDLVAAILGSPPETNTTITLTVAHPKMCIKPQKSRMNGQEQKRATTKKQKKKSTERERIAAVAILNGQIDLLQILPLDDCNFLGKKCYIFTLRHLEWVLDEDVKTQDSHLRLESRKLLIRNLAGNVSDQIDNGNWISMSMEREKFSPMNTMKLPPSREEKIMETLQSRESLNTNETAKEKSNGDLLAAEKVEFWRTLIESWKQRSEKECDQGRFPIVDGPMSVFFPLGTLQFMKSINVRVLFDFLCLKKTESGLVVEMFRAWRKKCGLKDMNLLPLAKHLTGISARIEASLDCKLNTENDLTNWITGPMMVLSGAAKEFLFDHSKMFSGTQFIERKTKTLSDEFCDWRLKTGLPALKGSGNVAMVSAWKTQVKDELEVEKSQGKVIPEEEIRKEIESESESVSVSEMILRNKHNSEYDQKSKRRKGEFPKSKQDVYSLAARQALNSPDFFAEYIGEERKMAMFKSVGITTAKEFIDAKKGKNSDLLKALIEFKSEQNNGKELQIPSCVSLLYDWSARIKKRINNLEKVKSDSVGMIGGRNSESVDDRNLNRSIKNPPNVKKTNSTNPFDALSASSKEFLIFSMNICTASDFLAARTTDIANAFIKWRKDKGMTPLKGLGSVASISGWKKLVRNKAASVGDLTLAELNLARNTKSAVTEKDIELRRTKPGTNEINNQLGALHIVSCKPRKVSLIESKNGVSSKEANHKNIFSVLSCRKKDIFHFEFGTRKLPSKGYETYLRYLGSDPASNYPLTIDTNGMNEIECVPIKTNIYEKFENISGRKPYDSLNQGIIDLCSTGINLGAPSQKQDNDHVISLEEMIRMFVFQKELLREGVDMAKLSNKRSIIENPNPAGVSEIVVLSQEQNPDHSQMVNMFEVLRNGKKRRILCLRDPIECGQSVELHSLPPHSFEKSWVKGNATEIRNFIEDRIRELPVPLLVELLRFVDNEVAALVSKYFEFKLKGIEFPSNHDGQLSDLSLTTIELFIARRRIHWVVLKIYENLRSDGTGPALEQISTNLAWTKAFHHAIRVRPETRSMVSESIGKEIREEIEREFMYRDFNGYASTMGLWCPLAKRLFRDISDVFVNFSFEFGSKCVEENLSNKLCCLISEFVVELRNLSLNPQNIKTKDLSELALTYKEGTNHVSGVFPSFEQITKKCFLEPYIDAMVLCDEPISVLDFTKAVRIVATKKSYIWREDPIFSFEDLQDIEVNEQTNIDVRWYLDTQILAVALNAIRCGISTSTADYKRDFLRNIDLKIMEAAHRVLGERCGETILFEDFKKQQRAVHSTLQSEELFSGCNDRSKATPSATPFFLGFIWPLLRHKGWKLGIGNLPSEICFVTPKGIGNSNRIYHRKDSLARQRSKFAREASSFGLGYIPKLTKRLFIKCLGGNNEIEVENETDSNQISTSPSTKEVLEKFGNERPKIKAIVIEIIALFNKLVPLTFGNEDDCHLTEGKEWCDVLDCTYLLKFLIIIPDMLQEADLSNRQHKLTVSVIHELNEFVSNRHRSLFCKSVEIPNEEYISEPDLPLKLRLNEINFNSEDLSAELGDSADESVEIIRPEDSVELTDFVTIVMKQTIIGKSAVEDTNRQGRYIAGNPCILCRHCLGVNGGKYFYGSYESIASAPTILERHLLRCTKIDDEVKQKILETKIRHSRQRKQLPLGAQSAFLFRLYDRMQSVAKADHGSFTSEFKLPKLSATEKSPHVSESETATKLSAVEETPNVSRVFNNHLEVMYYIQSTEPWRSDKPLKAVMSKYYKCLDYGGKLYSTNKTPLNFSSEWLYSKLAYRDDFPPES